MDDMLIVAKSTFEVKRLKYFLGNEFEMKDLGGAKNILGLVSTQYDAYFRLSAVLSLQSEDKEHSISHVPYSSVVWSCTRPDVSHAISVVCPGKVHWRAVKWILCYLQSAIDVDSAFDKDSGIGSSVIGYVDSNDVGDLVVT
jgi:hypothetical protein